MEIVGEPSFEEGLFELAKEIGRGRRLSLRQYFELLEWATLFTPLPVDGSSQSGIGYEIGGIHYVLLFTRSESAADVAADDRDYMSRPVRVRRLLERVPSGWGVIVDHGTEGEVRISPDRLTELKERIRIAPVHQEASDQWLAQTNQQLSSEGVVLTDRANKTKELWATLNGFEVLPFSKRARRIDWYFAVVADATPSEAAARCDEVWRGEYAAHPYLHHLSDDDIRKRLGAVRDNLLFVDRQALPHELDEREWRELYEHVRFEHEGRDIKFQEAIPIAERLARWPRLDLARAAFQGYGVKEGDFFKFGKAEHLEPMLSEGRVRIFPASACDSLLTVAQRDSELKRSIIIDSDELKFEHTDSDGIRHPIHFTGPLEISSKFQDYYLWCMSTSFDPRLFDDFRADSCLIIHDGQKFIDRMYAAMAQTLPDWDGVTVLVHYFDPVRPRDEVVSPLHKDFSYAYQREYRFIWYATSDDKISEFLEPVDLCLGDLRTIASVLRLQT